MCVVKTAGPVLASMDSQQRIGDLKPGHILIDSIRISTSIKY